MHTRLGQRVASIGAPLLTLLVLLASPALLGCDDDTGDPAGGGGSGGQGGAGTSSSGVPSNSCEGCTEEQECIQCNAVLPYKSCRTIVPVTAGTFKCAWLACSAATEVCVDSYPPGDGCPGAECVQLPAACPELVSCECLEAEIEVFDLIGFEATGCTKDADGNFTLTGMAM